MGTRVGIVIPAFDPDPARLVGTAEQLVDHLAPATLRIELDCPDPVTSAALARLSARASTVSVHTADRRRGKGAAIAAGFDAVAPETDVVAFVDADGATDVDAVGALIGTAAQTQQLVVGSRHHPDATIGHQQQPLRRLMSRAFITLAGWVLPVRLSDYQCGAKALPAAAWLRLRSAVTAGGFGFDLWLITAAADLDVGVHELPVAWTDRSGSTVAPVPTIVELAGTLVAIARRPR
jgi:RNase H-fold protein (predicted Holliday junction resolvase)